MARKKKEPEFIKRFREQLERQTTEQSVKEELLGVLAPEALEARKKAREKEIEEVYAAFKNVKKMIARMGKPTVLKRGNKKC